MKKRSKYRPKPIIANPIAYVIEGVRVTPESDLDRLRARELSSIDAFVRGAAGEPDWYEIYALVDICLQMARSGIGAEAIEPCERARRHLRDDHARFTRTGRMGTTGPGLQAFREVYEFADLQRQSISRKEYEDHIMRTIENMKLNGPTLSMPR